MDTATRLQPVTRREFLRTSGAGLGLIAFSQFAPAFLTRAVAANAPAPGKDKTILVLVQLAGGNDGLNTLVPHEDDQYYRLRPRLGLKGDQLLPIAPNLAFHQAAAPLAQLFQSGQLGIVQNVGYPNPNRSHFRSTEIWETGSDSDDYEHRGWIGRYLDNCCAGAPEEKAVPRAVSVGDELPPAFIGEQGHNLFNLSAVGGRRGRLLRGQDTDLLESLLQSAPAGGNGGFLSATMMDGLVTERRVLALLARDRAEAVYPQNQFAQALKRIGALIAGGLETRVYFASLGGFDTHANQAGTHQRLLGELANGLAAFQKDLVSRGLDRQVLTMTFSEFGRRPAENTGGGTDHGTAAPLFVMGPAVRERLVGTAPDLNVERNGDLRFGTDFRRVYATVLQRWLGADPAAVLPGAFDPLPFLA